MARRTVVVTGAGSYLGREAVAALAKRTGHRIVALFSPRTPDAVLETLDPAILGRRADLTHPSDDETAALLRAADRVLHFAWDRRGDAVGTNAGNEMMLEELMRHCRPQGFVFVSSVAGTPGARSVYGRSKHAIATRVAAFGGSILVLGLVIDAVPQGPFRLLCDAVRRLPVSLRFSQGEPSVYPIGLDAFTDRIVQLCDHEVQPAFVKGFERPVGFNAFLADLESRWRHRRITVRLPAGALLGAAAAVRRVPLAPRVHCDKILTLLYKDDAWLAGLPDPAAPGREASGKSIETDDILQGSSQG